MKKPPPNKQKRYNFNKVEKFENNLFLKIYC